ncbi:hypothetical protein L0Y49_00205 [bacterium]|nr:hypothetical protein [bacterium]
MKKFAYTAAFLLLGIFFIAPFVFATDFNSADFSVQDPVIFSAGYGTSSGFQLWGTISQVAIGTSTAAAFGLSGGFLYYPFVTTPVVTATAGSGQVDLSWTASDGFLGWVPSGYNVGQATVSGGPYSYSSSLGNVTSSTRTGLTNGTTYYFVVRVEDAFGVSIATSSEVSAMPTAPSPPPPPPSPPPSGGGGGGGGGIVAAPSATVVFSGRAYPGMSVILLKDAQIALSSLAGPDAKFSVSLSGLSAGNFNFSLYAEDRKGLRSTTLTFPVTLSAGARTEIGGIFLSPTIAVDKSEVRRGETVAIFGQSAPNADITIAVNSEEEFFSVVKSDADGIYLHNFDTTPLAMESHSTRSKAATEGEASPFSRSVSFVVGTKSVFGVPEVCPAKADLNNDCRVNLVDFSIAAYWYKRPISADFPAKEALKLNGDGKVDLVDFSIMAFYWTG